MVRELQYQPYFEDKLQKVAQSPLPALKLEW